MKPHMIRVFLSAIASRLKTISAPSPIVERSRANRTTVTLPYIFNCIDVFSYIVLFNYTEEKFNSDIEIVGSISENDKAEVETPAKDNSKQSLLEKGKEKFGNFFKKKEEQPSQEDELDKIKKLKELLDNYGFVKVA